MMCARHIYANWRKKHRLQEYQKRFWKIAKAPNEQLFNHYKNKLAAKTPRGWLDLEKTDSLFVSLILAGWYCSSRFFERIGTVAPSY